MSLVSPTSLAAELFWLVQTMLPGDAPFPSGGEVGAQAALAVRLIRVHGEAAPARVADALAAAGGPLTGRPEAERVAVVAGFERAEPALFAEVRKLLYLAYYEAPLVAQAIRATGLPYNLAPQPDGYAMPPFDPTLDTPRHGRGRWVRTEEVERAQGMAADG